MGFSDAVHLWEEQQLRVLVLASLILQYILLAAATLRKYRNWLGQKFITWLLYLASDAVAVYALATMFNRHRKQEWISTHRKDASLEALWAPILLLHLGGLDAITAYNIEDNELWSRHFLTAVSQIIVAIYVIRKSWSGGDRLLQAATILILVPGVLKCLEKPCALRIASINSIQGDDGKTDKDKRSSRRRRERRAHRQSSGSENNPARESQDGLEDAPLARSLHEYVQTARKLVPHPVPDAEEPSDVGAEANEASDNKSNAKTPLDLRGESEIFGAMPYRLFVDLACTYTNRLENIRSMVQKKGEAHRLVRCELSKAFDRLYTKNEVFAGLFHGERPGSRKGQILRYWIIELTFLAVGLFHKSNRESYNATDVKITYTLICCTASLEYISCYNIYIIMNTARQAQGRRPLGIRKRADVDHPWPDQVAQYNLIGYLARNKKYQGLRSRIPLVAKDYIDQLWCMKSCSKSSNSITQLIYDHVMDGWRKCIEDTASYRAFNDNRGQTTLKHKKCEGTTLKQSLQRPFDESILLWHLATDFCFHLTEHPAVANLCRVMSNYMVYLLFVNPEMLMTGARRSLFRATYKELKDLLQDEGELAQQNRVLCECELTAKVIEKVKADAEGEGLVHNAWTLAEELMGLSREKGEEKMWKVIQGVWVEMLCFSAGRCRGYLHAKSLGMGGEYLSYVWLLLWYMGMETLGERIQRNDPQAQGEVGATVSASAPLVRATGDNNARQANG